MTLSLITGAHGFIGQNLTRLLSGRGELVLGVGHGAWPQSRACGVTEWLNGEIDSGNLDTLIGKHGFPRAIFHLAGGSLVAPSFRSPLEDFHRSVGTTAKLLDWVRDKTPDSSVVCVSSAAVYGGQHQGPIPESASIRPESPYGIHKSIAEALCRSYATHFGLKVTIVRLFSVYGPGLRKQLLWDMCCRLERGESPFVLGGTGQEKRDWIHIEDAVKLISLAASVADPSCPVLNGGSGVSTKVNQFAQYVTDAWGVPPATFSGLKRPGDPSSLVADIELAASLGFMPRRALAAGVLETVSWFRNAK